MAETQRAAEGVERLLGLDEAGRGSLIGPLVVGGFLVRAEEVGRLRAAGADDSKRLSPARRIEVYRQLRAIGRPLSIAIAPRTIDSYVRDHRLNLLEAERFARLIDRSRPDAVHADACDVDAERFASLLKRLSRTSARVRASHRADATDPVVGAASIVAKVRRDAAIARLADRLGAEIGSGYPSDPRTIDFVRGALASKEPAPLWLRRSWAPAKRLRAERTARRLEAFT